MANITMTPQQLYDAAAKTESLANDYETAYKKIMTEVNNLVGTGWVGEDATAFQTQMQSFETSKYQKMAAVMREYAQFIKNNAEQMTNAIDSNVGRLNALNQ